MATTLENFDPQTAGKYDPGQIVILFDGRQYKSPEERMSTLQSLWLNSMIKMGWPSIHAQDLEPGKVRLMFYTYAGKEGSRDYPLWQAYAVKEMFDHLSDEGNRPMILGWSAENPFPMIGGSDPPAPPKVEKPKPVTSASATWSGHKDSAGTPHDRIMAIIEKEERDEAKRRKEVVEAASMMMIGEGAGAV